MSSGVVQFYVLDVRAKIFALLRGNYTTKVPIPDGIC